MLFKKIKIKNIRSYKEQEIIFPKGSFLLSGEIGSGKTTILLALEYALFGLQPGQRGDALLRNGAKTGEVILEFELDGKNVIIERKLKRTPKGISNDYASITINNEKYESSITEIKSKIISLLGYPQEFVKKNNIIYRYTVFTPQEQMKQIILEDPEARLNLLRHIFGVDKYKRIKDNLNIFLSYLKIEARVLQISISTIEKDIEELNQKKENLEKIKDKLIIKEKELREKTKKREEIEKRKEEINFKINERRIFSEEVEKTKIMLAAKKETLNSSLKEEEELKLIVKENSKKLFNKEDYEKILKKISDKKNELEELTFKQLELNAKLKSLDNKNFEISEKKDMIFKIKFCPTCLQDVGEFHKHNILNEIEKEISDIKKMKESLLIEFNGTIGKSQILKNELQQLENEKLKMEEEKIKMEKALFAETKISELNKKKKLIEKDIEILLKHIEKLKEKIIELSNLELQLSTVEAELRRAVYEEKNSEIFLAEIKKEEEFIEKEIFSLEKRIAQKESDKKKFYKILELSDWLSTKFLFLVESIERNTLIKLRVDFSTLFRKWFSFLVQDNSLEPQIDEIFAPIILQGETEMNYDYLSGGERTAIALAYRLALNQTINSFFSKIKTKGIIILDEPTEGFSDFQIEKMRDVLKELNTEQLIIVSHEQKIESFIDNVLKVYKEGNSSYISKQ